MIADKNRKIRSMIASVMDKSYTANRTLISLDLKDGLIVEGFKKLIDFSENSINFSANNKNIYVFGDNIYITSFSKNVVHIKGSVSRIEISEVE